MTAYPNRLQHDYYFLSVLKLLFFWTTSVIFLDHPQFSFWHCTLHWVLLCATKLLELNLYLKTLVLSFMIKQVEHLWSRRCSGAAESAVLNLITFKRFSNYQQLPENCCEHVECHPHISLQHTTLHSLAIPRQKYGFDK